MGKNKENYKSFLRVSRKKEASLIVKEIGGKLQGTDLEAL